MFLSAGCGDCWGFDSNPTVTAHAPRDSGRVKSCKTLRNRLARSRALRSTLFVPVAQPQTFFPRDHGAECLTLLFREFYLGVEHPIQVTYLRGCTDRPFDIRCRFRAVKTLRARSRSDTNGHYQCDASSGKECASPRSRRQDEMSHDRILKPQFGQNCGDRLRSEDLSHSDAYACTVSDSIEFPLAQSGTDKGQRPSAVCHRAARHGPARGPGAFGEAHAHHACLFVNKQRHLHSKPAVSGADREVGCMAYARRLTVVKRTGSVNLPVQYLEVTSSLEHYFRESRQNENSLSHRASAM